MCISALYSEPEHKMTGYPHQGQYQKKKRENQHENDATLKSLSLDDFWLPADWMRFFCLKTEK